MTPTPMFPLICLLLICLTCLACLGNDSDDQARNEPLSCMEAVDIEGELFLKLDSSCTQDSDCTVTPRGSCGCPLPLNKSADIPTYSAARQDLLRICGDSISRCEEIACDVEVTEMNVVCNAQKLCDQPR